MRERNTLPWFEYLLQDLRFALRQLRKAPGFTTVVIITLALGIGVNTALFSIVNTVLLHPIALPRPGELVAVDAAKPNFETGSISYPNFRDWQRDNHSFTALAIFRHLGFLLTGAGQTERIHGDLVSSDLFSMLGVKPVIGRLFAPGEDEIGRAPLVLIGQGFWARKLGSDPDVIGRAIDLDGRASPSSASSRRHSISTLAASRRRTFISPSASGTPVRSSCAAQGSAFTASRGSSLA